MTFYVFDLDGTLADHRHRLPLITRVPGGITDWSAFNAACVDDEPIGPVVRLLHDLAAWSSNRVEIWTGRSDEVRGETWKWLARHGLDYRLDRLRMRRADDHRDDVDLKLEFLQTSEFRPHVVFEDRQRVVDMWRAHGVTCLQVAQGGL